MVAHEQADCSEISDFKTALKEFSVFFATFKLFVCFMILIPNLCIGNDFSRSFLIGAEP